MEQKEQQAAFKAAYAALNAAQKSAVDTIEGPVMVIAGPGTGKTQILTLRIANILLQTDTAPSSILALTFTESGAKAMRTRLRQYIGPRAYQVPIYTFHAFAGQLIAEYPDAFPEIVGGRPATDLEKIRILETILSDSHFKLLRPGGRPDYYIGPLRHMLSTLKQEYIKPPELAQLIATQVRQLDNLPQFHEKGVHKGKVRGEYSTLEKNIAKNQELLAVYQQYEALLKEQHLFDFDDMLLQAVQALETNETMLRDLQETYQYVLADEHQDVNGTQNRLLEVLVSYHDQPNIFVVGDEKQAIYRFQGASLENFLFFENTFTGTKTISLTENYRSAQGILDLAHSLVATEDEVLAALRVPLQAVTPELGTMSQRQFAHQAVEDAAVVDGIKTALAKGISPTEIAVIVRTNLEVEHIASQLRQAGISVAASAEGDILRHPITAVVLSLIEAIAYPEREAALFSLLHLPCLKIPAGDLVKILSARTYSLPLADLITDVELTNLQLKEPERVKAVRELLEAARQQSQTAAPHRVLETVLQSSGLLDELIADSPLESVRVVRRLFDEIESLVLTEATVTLPAVYLQLQQRQAYGLPLLAPYINTESDAVAVMTAHKAKGLEFEVVFLPHQTDNLWGAGSKRTHFHLPITKLTKANNETILDDERRLLYVAMTRAKRELYISFSDTNAAGRVLTPSRLVAEIEATLLPSEDTVTFTEQFDLLSEIVDSASQSDALDEEALLELFLTRGFSATSFNNFKRSPFDYLYRNLLRIPEVQSTSLMYGNAIHSVLERITKAANLSGEVPTLSKIKTWLEQGLDRLPLTTHEFTRLHERGLAALAVYREHLATSLPATTKVEVGISVVLETDLPEVPEIKLTGKLDRLDIAEDGRVLRVVDYKTGKAKTRNAIEGKTKNDDGGYKRQLVFYALLLSLYDDERYTTNVGVLSFVEPDKHGQIVEHEFVITPDEVAALKEEIIAAASSIASGAAWEAACDPAVSSYCHLVEQLKKR